MIQDARWRAENLMRQLQNFFGGNWTNNCLTLLSSSLPYVKRFNTCGAAFTRPFFLRWAMPFHGFAHHSALCNAVARHRKTECKAVRFDSTWESRIFSYFFGLRWWQDNSFLSNLFSKVWHIFLALNNFSFTKDNP